MLPDQLLIIDHQRHSRRRAAEALEAAGYGVRATANARRALQLMDFWIPSLIVVELDLPGLDGLTLTCVLRSRARTRAIPIIGVAAQDSPRAMALQRAGFHALLSKPFDPQLLVRRVDAVLGRTAPRHRWEWRARHDSNVRPSA